MVLQIYGNTDNNPRLVPPNMFFDFNNQEYEFDTSPRNILYDINANATINFDLNLFDDQVESKIRMLLYIYDNRENVNQIAINEFGLKDRLKDNFYFLSNQYGPTHEEYKNLLYIDFWFNIVKAYYTKYKFKPDTFKWFYHNEYSYVLKDIPNADNKTKIYVAPNRIYNDSSRVTKYRKRLVFHLLNQRHLGYIGSATLNKNWVLQPHGDYPNINSIVELLNISAPRKEKWGYAPIHWEYINDTFISIYTETIEYGNEYFISEKTYDPLIRGHFVLPFSNVGFIRRLKSLGFKFPKFIDYNYDDIVDDNLRYDKYQDEVSRLLQIDMDNWRQHWNDNIEILKYNRQLMIDRPYDRLDFYKLL